MSERIEKVDKNELAVYTTDPILGALVAGLVAEGALEWVISSPGSLDIGVEPEENVLFWASLVPTKESTDVQS